MALSPADFAAYSRATGAPYPESPQERAELAPEVLAFRRGQLTQPEQQSNLPAILGGTVLGLGALGAALAGTRRFARGTKTQSTPQRDLSVVRQAATGRASGTTAPSTPAPPTPGTPPSNEGVAPSKATAIPQATVDVAQEVIDRYADDYAKSQEKTELARQRKIVRQMEAEDVEYENLGRSILRDLSAEQKTTSEFNVDKFLEENEALYRRLVSAEDVKEKRVLGAEFFEQLRSGQFPESEAPSTALPTRANQPGAFTDLTSIQDQLLNQARNQQVNAVETGEDQMTGRVMRGVQRNEDLDASQVNRVASQTGSAEVATSIMPDGVPADQTEGIDLSTGKRFLINPPRPPRPSRTGLGPGQSIELEQVRPSAVGSSAARFLDTERQEIASQLAEQGLPISPGRIEAELANRLSGSEAWTYGPKYTQRKQALQLGATYDPRFFENLKTPSVVIAGETIPTTALKEPVFMKETAERLQEKVDEKKDWLGNIRLEEQLNQNRIYNQLDQLSERDQKITDYLNYIDTDWPRKSFYSSPNERDATLKKRYEAEGARIEQEQINEKMGDLLRQASTSERRVAGAQRSTQEQIGNLALPQKLKSGVEEGQRLFFEQDLETGEPNPATLELRSERRMIDTEEKGGGGRKVAEYVGGGGREEGIDLDVQNILESAQTSQSPRYYEADQFGYTPDLEEGSFTSDRTQVGRVIDTEGVRLTNPPGRNPFENLDTETLQQISLMGSKADSYNATKVLQRRSTPEGALRGIDVSRDIMKIKQSAPPERAQALINQYIKNLQKF